jgi:methyl-accepting chemotaxis protein
MESRLAQTHDRCTLAEERCRRLAADLEQVQQNTEAIDERVNGVRDGIDVLSHGAAGQQEYVDARMNEFVQSFTSQRAAIASVVAGQAQTDDVVEGVVEAMELLHTIINVDREAEFA